MTPNPPRPTLYIDFLPLFALVIDLQLLCLLLLFALNFALRLIEPSLVNNNSNNNHNNNNNNIIIMSSHHVGVTGEEMEEEFGGGYGLDLEELADAAENVLEREVVSVPREYEDTNLVPGGPQEQVALEADEGRKLSRKEVADMVGSYQLCRGNNALQERYSEWQYSTEVQRDIMASRLVALGFFSIGCPKNPNVYIAQLVRVSGEMEWFLVENGFDVHSIGKALCSTLRHLSVLIWCKHGQVKAAMRRFVSKPGVCTAFGEWEPETREPPRWPSLRGASALEASEVVWRVVEAVREEGGRRKSKMRFHELDGVLVAAVRKWKKERRMWNGKGDEVPERPVWMPNQLWGCPLLPEYRAHAVVARCWAG